MNHRNIMMHASSLAVLLAACSGSDPAGSSPIVSASVPHPLVILIVEAGPSPSPDIPWTLCEGAANVSIGMLSPDRDGLFGPDPSSILLMESLDRGMLVALVDAGSLPGDLERDHIQIWTGTDGTPEVVPPEMAEALPDSEWIDPVRRHELLRDLFRVYLPDLAMIGVRVSNPAILKEICDCWMTPAVLSSRTVVIYSASEDENFRGWTVIGGPSVNGETPLGLTTDNLLSTMEMLLGLDWESGLPDRIPAVGILRDPPAEWPSS